MSPKEFLERVICPSCRTKVNQKAPFNKQAVCNCRQSLCNVIKVYGWEEPNRSYKLYVTEEMIIYISIFGDPIMNPLFYVATSIRPFYPLFEQKEIPDYIFLPLDKLITKLELLTTFS